MPLIREDKFNNMMYRKQIGGIFIGLFMYFLDNRRQNIQNIL